jgi:predicted phosphodiesterase
MARLALFGGLYSNYLALEAAITDARCRQVDAIYCLGDLGAFGPHPDRVFPLIHEANIACIQGNYDDSIGNQLDDCQCGYTDPRDNHFAQISYDYTLANTSQDNKDFLRELPRELRVEVAGKRMLLCHGSPRKVNEFLWESTTPTHFLELMFERESVDIIAATHTGIRWRRHLADGPHGRREFVNVGVLGRPENDGNTHVWYTMIEVDSAGEFSVEFVPVEYDHCRLAREMEAEGLPSEFTETVLTGYWTSCLEILPSKERRQGKH